MKSIASLVFLAVAILFSGCVTARGPAVQTASGVQAVTQPQKDFVQAVTALPVGASKAAVRQALGEPVMSGETTWFYELQEDSIRGGHYVTATLTFDARGLKGGVLRGGYTQRMRKRD